MKKYLIIIIIIVVLIGLGFLVFFNNQNNSDNIKQNTNNTLDQRVNYNINVSNNENMYHPENKITNILQNKNEIIQEENNEIEISSYATTIKDNSEGRLTNISITCSILNNTVIEAGKTFSFNEVVGQPTAEKGYQEASVIIDHKTEKGIGGRKLSSK